VVVLFGGIHLVLALVRGRNLRESDACDCHGKLRSGIALSLV
jgi:hypothetical protein